MSAPRITMEQAEARAHQAIRVMDALPDGPHYSWLRGRGKWPFDVSMSQFDFGAQAQGRAEAYIAEGSTPWPDSTWTRRPAEPHDLNLVLDALGWLAAPNVRDHRWMFEMRARGDSFSAIADHAGRGSRQWWHKVYKQKALPALHRAANAYDILLGVKR